MMLTLPPDYRPSDSEEFMNPIQIEYFRQRLLRWRASLLREADGTLASLSQGGIHEADITDRASVETDRALELRTRDRARKLISKIDQALLRIENGTYGFCEETDEPIGLKRLEARPIATLSIEAQERHERRERVSPDGNGNRAHDRRIGEHSGLRGGRSQIARDRIDLLLDHFHRHRNPARHSARVLSRDRGDRRRAEHSKMLKCLEIGLDARTAPGVGACNGERDGRCHGGRHGRRLPLSACTDNAA